MSKQEIRELLEKARRSLHAAERPAQDGDYDFSVSRAYYAMFYGAQALLLTRDIRRSKHSGVIAAFISSSSGAVRSRAIIFSDCEMRLRIGQKATMP